MRSMWAAVIMVTVGSIPNLNLQVTAFSQPRLIKRTPFRSPKVVVAVVFIIIVVVVVVVVVKGLNESNSG